MGTLKENEKEKHKGWKAWGCKLFLIVSTVLLLSQGLFFLFGFGPLFRRILEGKMVIRPGTPAYEVWRRPSLPTTLRIYLFSVRNPREVEGGARPDLQEVGPFTYREELERINEEFHEDGTVTYETKKEWFFQPSLSLPLSTRIMTVDVPVLATAEYGRGSLAMEWANSALFATRPGLFVEKTARQVLFEGYSDPLLDMGSLFAASSGIPMDKFGWFYKRNGTTWSDGKVRMATGAQNYSEVGEIRAWKGSNRTLYPSSCGEVRGTSAGFTPVHPDRQYIDYFSTDICRPIRFSRNESVEVEGVPGIKFLLNATDTFGNTSTNPSNWCYHPVALPTGVHNSTGCKGGDTTLKTFVSLPHFLGADPAYLGQFQGGISPDPARHSASMTLHMETAIPIQVLMRLQIILQLRPNPNIGSFFGKIPELFLPVFWFDAEASIEGEMASQVRLLDLLPRGALVGGLTSLALALANLLAVVYLCSRREGKDSGPEGTVEMEVDMRSKTLKAAAPITRL